MIKVYASLFVPTCSVEHTVSYEEGITKIEFAKYEDAMKEFKAMHLSDTPMILSYNPLIDQCFEEFLLNVVAFGTSSDSIESMQMDLIEKFGKFKKCGNNSTKTGTKKPTLFITAMNIDQATRMLRSEKRLQRKYEKM